MARTKRRANVDDRARLVGDLFDQIKVLVSAVDDLRCEVEWWARNAVDQRDSLAPSAPTYVPQNLKHDCVLGADEALAPSNSAADCSKEVTADATAGQGTETSPCDCPERAAEMRLASLELGLAAGRRAEWPDEWDGNDAQELPVGKVIPVNEELWEAVLDLRPAHVVGRGCCCEEGIGAPYLLAWQYDEGCFLRELSDEESYELQRTCLDARAEQDSRQNAQQVSETQLGLLVRQVFRRG